LAGDIPAYLLEQTRSLINLIDSKETIFCLGKQDFTIFPSNSVKNLEKFDLPNGSEVRGWV